MSDVAYLKSQLGVHANFPKEGITFIDIFPCVSPPLATLTPASSATRSPSRFVPPSCIADGKMMITHFISHIAKVHPGVKPDVIVGLDARGFLFGPIIAMRLGAAFVPVRKAGKLCVRSWKLEL